MTIGYLLGRILAEKLVFNPATRIYTFRVLVISSLVSTVVKITWGSNFAPDVTSGEVPLFKRPLRELVRCVGVGYLVCPVVLVHHLASIFKWRFFYEIFDWVLVTCETVAFCWFLLFSPEDPVTWNYQNYPIFRVANYAQMVALPSTWMTRTATMAFHGCIFFSPFTFLSGCDTRKRGKSARVIIFGRSLCQTSSRGESSVIKALRALFAMVFVTVLFIFGCYSMIIDPFRDTGFVPFKIYQTQAKFNTCDIGIAQPVLTIVATAYVLPSNGDVHPSLRDAVNVTPVLDPALPSQLNCEFIPFKYEVYDRKTYVTGNLETIKISCTGRQDEGPFYSVCGTTFTFPDLLITINFTRLGITSTFPITMGERTVSIIVGLTDNMADVISETRPAPLSPGSHLLGSISLRLKRRFKEHTLAALGALGSSRTFLVSDIAALTPDPSLLAPGLDNTTATLRLYYQRDLSELTFSEEYKEKSVLGGFSAFGGFWTFVNGAFVLVFGSSLMLTLCGIKPLSVFGIVHCFQQGRLYEAWQAAFPRIRTEGGVPGSEEAGLVAFLRERLVDLDPIGDDIEDVESQRQGPVATYDPLPRMEMTELMNQPTTLENVESRRQSLVTTYDPLSDMEMTEFMNQPTTLENPGEEPGLTVVQDGMSSRGSLSETVPVNELVVRT